MEGSYVRTSLSAEHVREAGLPGVRGAGSAPSATLTIRIRDSKANSSVSLLAALVPRSEGFLKFYRTDFCYLLNNSSFC